MFTSLYAVFIVVTELQTVTAYNQSIASTDGSCFKEFNEASVSLKMTFFMVC